MPTGLNICVISPSIPPDFGGGGKLAYDQTVNMAARGEKCTIITRTKGAKGGENLDIVRMPQLAIGPQQRGRIVDYLSLYPRFLRIMRRVRPDVVYVMSADPWTLLAVAAAKTIGIPVVLETSLVGSDDPLTIRDSRFGSVKFEILQDVDALVSMSPSLDECAIEAGFPESKRWIIPNLVDIEMFHPADAERKARLRTELGLARFERTLVYVGAIIPRKRVREVIEAFADLSADVRDGTGLLLVGPDVDDALAYRAELDELVAANGLADQVVFTGNVYNVQDWMAASDLFAFASLQEGFGTVVVEAMATGIPPVVQRIPRISEFIITSGEDGYITDSADEFRERIEELLTDDDARAALGEAARKSAEDRFGIDQIVDQYLALFQTITERGAH